MAPSDGFQSSSQEEELTMANKIFVNFAFTNKKGEKKNVRFPMDKQSYDAYYDPSVPAEWTEKMMLIEYKEYCDEKKHERRMARFPVDDEGREIDIPDPDSMNLAEKIASEIDESHKRSVMLEILMMLPPKQREAFSKVRLQGMKSIDAAKEMGIAKNTFSEHLSRAEKAIEKIIGKKIF